jgi:hypothetical protein
MANQSKAWTVILLFRLLVLTEPTALFGAAADGNSSTGIITARLSPRQIKTWRTIEQKALAHDAAGQPLHPVLNELFNWAKVSNFPIYIEMPEARGRWDYAAGKCLFERQTPLRNQPMAVTILLYITVIDRAPGKRMPGEQGFVPFEGLKGEERYCETLAHELTHVRQSVTDLEFLQLTDRQESLNDEILRLQSLRLIAQNRQLATREMRMIAGELRLLSERIDGPAIAAEQQVWRELRAR